MSDRPPLAQGRRRQTDGVVLKERLPRNRKSAGKPYTTRQRELITRLNHLKTEARAVCESYVANLDSDVSTLVEFLDGSSEVCKPEDVKAATMEEWSRILDDLSVKPHKGRKKDLRRIDRAIQAMMESAFE